MANNWDINWARYAEIAMNLESLSREMKTIDRERLTVVKKQDIWIDWETIGKKKLR